MSRTCQCACCDSHDECFHFEEYYLCRRCEYFMRKYLKKQSLSHKPDFNNNGPGIEVIQEGYDIPKIFISIF